MAVAGRVRFVAAAAAAVLAAIAGCQTGGSGGPPGGSAPDWSPAAVRELLLDAWVTDGKRGYFVDAAGSSASPAFSLYDTRWELELSLRAGRGTAGLDPARVARWLGGALDGAPAGSGLPPVGGIGYAVDLLRLLGRQVDGARVARAVERLRIGTAYRSDRSVDRPDWGSTATAVRALVTAGLPVPPDVARAAAGELARQSAAPDIASVVSTVVPLLQIAAEIGAPPPGSAPAAVVARLTAAAGRTLAGAPADPVSLSARYTLQHAARRLAVPVPPFEPAGCRGLGDAHGQVHLPGQVSGDPQVTLYALELGCPGVHAPAAPPAHSRAGWPMRGGAAPSISAAAVRVAVATGTAGPFLAGLREQATTVWIPALRRQPRSADAAVLRAGLAQLAASIPGQLVRVTAALRVAVPAPGVGENDLSVLLWLVGLGADRTALAARRAEVRSTATAHRAAGPASMAHAAWVELAARDLADPALHAAAVAEVRRLRVSPGTYATGPDGPSARTASLTASALGGWIDPAPGDLFQSWAGAGLCAAGTCTDTAASGRLDYAPWRVLALLSACRRPGCGTPLPVVL